MDSARTIEVEDGSPEAVERRTEAHARYAAAILHDWDEEPEEAAAEFYKAAIADPGNESLVLEVSQRLLQLKQIDKALDVLTKATATPKASGLLFAQLGRVYSLLGKKDQAIEANKVAIKKMPQSLMGYRNMAQIHLQNRQYVEGLKVLEQAGKQPGADAGYLIELGELYAAFIRGGAPDTAKPLALDAFNRAAQLNPTNPLQLQRLADGLTALGESEKATGLYLKLVERFPTLPGLREKLAEIYLRKEDRKGAATQLEAIIRDNPNNPQVYYLLGNLAYEAKDMKKALEHFNKAMVLNPGFEQVYYDVAGAQINLNQGREALGILEKARSRFQNNFVNEFFTALAFSRLKEYTNAVNHFVAAEVIARVTETNRLNHTFYFQLGAAYERTQKFDEAEKYFKKSLSLAPDFTEVMNYMGYMWAERGVKLAEARDLIEKAVKREPQNAAFLDSLAWVLFKMDKSKEALDYMLKALQNTEEPDATLYDHLGDIYSSLKQTDKARESWRKALAIEPNQQIQKKLDAGATSENAPR